MATALQQQLQAFAARSAKSAKVRNATIVFDPKDVDHIDTATIFNLGLNGFVELKTKDGRFAEFEKELFSQTSATLNRETLTKKDNEKLDDHLSRFLRLLSPFVMQKAAHKVLEYLVRRFRSVPPSLFPLAAALLLCCRRPTKARLSSLFSPQTASTFSTSRPLSSAFSPTIRPTCFRASSASSSSSLSPILLLSLSLDK